MRKWKVVTLPMLLGLLLAPLAAAQQTNDDLKREVDQLKRDLQAVLQRQNAMERENDNLRSKLDSVDTVESNLEQMINTLSRGDYAAGTTVESASNPIRIFGEFRSRSGYTFDRDFGIDDPSGNSADDEGTFVDARFLLGFDFHFDRDVEARFSVQANGLYDNNDTPASSSGLTDISLYEGWIQFNNIFGRSELSSRTGRQEITLGNEFQFGNNDFFSGETFDGTHTWWENENFALHLILVKLNTSNSINTRDHPFNSSSASFEPNSFDDDELYSLYFTLKTIENHELDIYWIYFNGHNGGSLGSLGNHLASISEGDDLKQSKESGTQFYYHTIGARIGGVFPSVAAGLDWNVEGAYQTGNLSGTDTDVEGFSVEAEIGITFDADNKFRVFVRFLFAEGYDANNNGQTVDKTGYIPLFPERHAQAGSGGTTDYRARYGLLDVIPMDNVITVQGGLTFDPAADWTLGATVLWAQHDEDVFTAGGMEDGIGVEVDAFAEYRYSAEATLSGGVGVFFPDDGAPLKDGSFSTNNNDDIFFLFYLQARILF